MPGGGLGDGILKQGDFLWGDEVETGVVSLFECFGRDGRKFRA
jgi:hypothetical protein